MKTRPSLRMYQIDTFNIAPVHVWGRPYIYLTQLFKFYKPFLREKWAVDICKSLRLNEKGWTPGIFILFATTSFIFQYNNCTDA